MNGIFVILSTVCFSVCRPCNMDHPLTAPNQITEFVRISMSSTCTYGEVAKPICEWTGHKWEPFNGCVNESGDMVFPVKIIGIWTRDLDDCLIEKCIFCNKKRRKIKETKWVEE